MSKFCVFDFYETFIPQRRVPENSLSGSHWFEWLSLPCLINLKFDSPPTTHSKSTSLLGGWVVGWAYLPFQKFVGKNFVFFFFFSLMCLAIRVNDFKIIFSTNKPKIALVERK